MLFKHCHPFLEPLNTLITELLKASYCLFNGFFLLWV